MSLLVVGLSHRTSPVGVLERAVVASEETGKVLGELLQCENVSEALLLSTCNRVEVYAVVQTFHGGLGDVSGVLARQAGAELADLAEHLYVHYAGAGVDHLFAVAAGLDSMVVGEPQILGQLREAYSDAVAAGTVGSTLHELAQHALRVGKRVHTETGIDAAGASLVSEALADADAALQRIGGGPGLAGRRALVVGAGSMGALAAAQLRRAGAAEVVVANRSMDTARRLAAAVAAEGTPARAVGLGAVLGELVTAEVVVSATGTVGTVLDAATLAAAAPLVVCDLGMPRDVEEAAAALPGVTVIDLSTLQRRLADRAAGTDVRVARKILAEEVRGYLAAQRSAEVTPTVTALRQRAAEVVDAELLRLDTRLPGLDAAVRAELSCTVRRVIDKLLHTPTVRVKELAETGGGQTYADALRELFELDPQAPAAVSAPGGVSAVPSSDGERP